MAAAEEMKQSSSGLDFRLHPVRGPSEALPRPGASRLQTQLTLRAARPPLPPQLVMINISDHFTRMRANYPEQLQLRVLGCLLGSQTGRTVDISNSFEMSYTTTEQGVAIDQAFLAKKLEQCASQPRRRPPLPPLQRPALPPVQPGAGLRP
jgi:hypothetical protein